MSKYIKLTPEHIADCIKEFEKDLTSSKWADGKVSFSKNLGTISRKAKIFFTEVAWMKMTALVREFDKEVAWHGVAFRGNDKTKDEYIIKDIVVYPQKVTGSTVEMDTEEYAKWIEENIEDERFFDIRMQGHSHVNMTVSPSSVDLTHQEAILEQLSDKLFYIFMIWNKRGESNIKIYDLAKNILFENTDIEIELLDDGYGIKSFIKEAKLRVKDRIIVNNTGYQYGKYPYNYQYSYDNSKYIPPSQDKPSVNTKDDKKDNQKESVIQNKSKKRKGKRKKDKIKVYKNEYSNVKGIDDMKSAPDDPYYYCDNCY